MAAKTNHNQEENTDNGTMSVQEAGRKGGETTSKTHGKQFYEEIGHKGGQRVRELVEEGKESEGSNGKTGTSRKTSR